MTKLGLLTKHFKEDYDEKTPWDGDILGREVVADYLTPFIGSITQPFVISVDAPYGGGKTFFLRNWHHDLKKQGYKTVYFNAWESDFTTDPLIPFMASIGNQLTEFGEDDSPHTRKLATAAWKSVEKWGPVLIRRGVPLVIGVADSGLFDGETFKKILEFLKGIVEILKGLIGFFVKDKTKNASSDLIEDFQKQRNGLAEFRDSLTKAIQQSTKKLPLEQQKLIIFVDELDRCRPTYAVEVLERIKHLFCVPGVVFILGMDEKQIANAMAAVFGDKLDTDGYLRRFIDWRFRLPKPSNMQYSKFLFEKFNLANLSRFSADTTKNIFRNRIRELDPAHGIFAEALGLTLRQQEQCYIEFNLYLRTAMPDEVLFSVVLGAIGALRVKERDLLEKALSSEKGRDALDDYLSERIDFKGQKIWGCENWKNFSPIFRSWFYGPDHAEFITEKSKNEHFNKNEDYTNNKKIKKYKFWSTCQIYYDNIFYESDIVIEKPLAQTIIQRLDSINGMLPKIKPSAVAK